MKETKKKVVNIQEYKEKRKQTEIDRNELIALILIHVRSPFL